MSDTPDTGGNAFTRKLGPLPVWGYAAIIVGVGVVFWYWRKHSASQVNPTTVSTVPPTGAADTSGVNQPQMPYSGQVTSFPQGTAAPQTNAQWAKFVSDSLIANGSPPDLVNNALSAYVGGGTLDPSQKSLIDVALQKYGNAPQGVLPIQSTPATPYTGYKYTVQAGDKVSDIVSRYYGSGNPDITARIIADANSGITYNEQTKSFNTLQPGQVILLPTNGVAGVQNNSLNKYDPGHTL